MKKLVLTMVALLTMSTAMAQSATCECKDHQNGHKGFSPEKRVEMLAQKLGLSDEQKAKILALDKEMMADVKADKAADEKSRKEQFEKRMQKQKQMDKKMKEILTAEQYAEYQKMQPKMGKPHGPRPGMNPAMFQGGRPGEFAPTQE